MHSLMICFVFLDVVYTGIYETMLLTSFLYEVFLVFFLDMTLSTRDIVTLIRSFPAFTQLDMHNLMRHAFLFSAMLIWLILHPYFFELYRWSFGNCIVYCSSKLFLAYQHTSCFITLWPSWQLLSLFSLSVV